MDDFLRRLENDGVVIPDQPVSIILDTDIGPDVDDVGALALLHVCAHYRLCRILAVTHCTSSPYGVPCVHVINEAYRQADIPVGTLQAPNFLDAPEYRRFNEHLARKDINRTCCAPDATGLIIERLRKQPDNSVVLVAIGPLINLYNCLMAENEHISCQDIRTLIKAKIRRTVIMGGAACGREWNFAMHPLAARTVCSDWPAPIVFSTFEIGASIISGRRWAGMPEDHPVREAYRLHAPEGRPSWDLTAVWAAVFGYEPLYRLSGNGRMVVDLTGKSCWQEEKAGAHTCLQKVWTDEKIAELLDNVISRDIFGVFPGSSI